MSSRWKTLQELIDALHERGDRPFLIQFQKEGTRQWSYAELSDHVYPVAAGLRAAGIQPGDPVGLMAELSFDWIVACLATLRAGAAAMPLDIQFSDDVLKGVIEDSGTKLVFTTPDQAERVTAASADVRVVLLDSDESEERSLLNLYQDNGGEIPAVGPEDRAALFYTSGTTGPPKGVPLRHRNLTFQLDAIGREKLISEGDRVLLPLPLHHVYPFVLGIFIPLSLGLPIIRPKSLTGPQVIRAIREGDVTVVAGVPRLYKALFEGIQTQIQSGGNIVSGVFDRMLRWSGSLHDRFGVNAGRYLFGFIHKRFGPELRLLASGGSELNPELARKLMGLGWEVAIGYGLTETAPLLTLNLPADFRIGSVGKIVPGVDIRIDESAKPGEEEGGTVTVNGRSDFGEVMASGPNVFEGYLNLPEKTAEALTDDGWFRTGDLGYVEDGYLYLVGRSSTMIVTEGGENVQPDNIEEVFEQSPVIREAGVLQKENRLVALFVPELNEIPERDPDGIEKAMKNAVSNQSRQLPSYQRIGDFAITRKALPRTRLGKIRRHILPDRYDEAKQEAEAGEQIRTGPMSPDEMSNEDRALLDSRAAKETWDWLVERYPDQPLTPDTSPQVDLGIDSLEWLNITMELRQRVGVELDEEAIGRIETVRDLLREVSEAAEGGAAVPKSPPLEQPETALTAQQQRWLEPLPPGLAALARGLYQFNRLVMRSVFQLRFEGADRIPEQGPFVISPNHVSYLDPFAVASALPYRQLRRTYWAGWVGVAFKNPLFRLVSRLAQAIPIDPQRGVFSSLAFAASVLKRGQNLIWFPEGGRSPDGELKPFKPGIGLVLDRYNVPVIPVFLHGPHEAMPVGQFMPRPGPITVVFGEPVQPEQLKEEGEGKAPQDQIASALHDRVERLGRQKPK